jgi:hypothetical protein
VPVLNGKQTGPSGTRSAKLRELVLELVDGLGNPVRNAYETATGRAIGGSEPATLNSDGTWTLTVPGHDGITPSGTYWRKRAIHEGEPASEATLLLPNTGGPYNEDDIAVDLGAVPAPVPTNQVDYAEITANVTGLALSSNLVLVPIPGVTVTVPASSRTHMVHAHVEAQCATAGLQCTVFLAPVGSTPITAGIGRATIRSNAVNVDESAEVWGKIGPGAGGDYGAFLSAASGTWQVSAATFAPVFARAMVD